MSWWEDEIKQRGGVDDEPLLYLDLDEHSYEGYLPSDFDISEAGHSRLILAKDKEAFLDEQALRYRKSIENFLKNCNIGKDGDYPDLSDL
ncbi:MAG: hypothetical protein IIB83_09815 [Bacteroidetes bacterium]|nr:hypothetical protein [Bacteroidota bacterium]